MNGSELERIARTEANIKNIKEDIIDLRDNHIHSIYRKLDAVNGKLIAVLTTLIGALIVGILNIVVR